MMKIAIRSSSRCRSTPNNSNKIDFALFQGFYKFLEILEDCILCWEYFNEKPKIKRSKQPLGRDQAHSPAGSVAQPRLEESWLGRERRDGPLAARPHRRKKKKIRR
jgi:hypothetical protein